jgi:hypothetical protein
MTHAVRSGATHSDAQPELALDCRKRMPAEGQATQLRRAVRMMRAQIERLIADQKMDADNR